MMGAVHLFSDVPASVWWAAVAAAVASLLLTPVAIRVLMRSGTYDVPSERSSHDHPIIRGVGIVVIPAGLAAAAFVPGRTSVPVLACAALACILGAVEDLRGVSVRVRLACQGLVALPVAFLTIQNGEQAGTAPILIAGLTVVGILLVVATINATNFMDGINGISIAFAVAAGASYAVYLVQANEPALAALPLCIAGALIGFGPFNLPKARAFLGDAGSYGLGGAMGAIAVLTFTGTHDASQALAPLVIYLADTGWAIILKIRHHQSLATPHRWHAYQRLTDAGWPHTAVAAYVGGWILATGLLTPLAAQALNTTTSITIAAECLLVCAYLLTSHFKARSRLAASGTKP